MKTLPFLCLGLAAALPVAPRTRAADTDTPPPPAAADAPAAPARDAGLRFNFRGAPLEQVLNYLSDAAGLVIVLDGPVRGTVNMWSTQPVSKEEAIQLLNISLNKNGYSATLQGRNLIVTSKDDARKRNIPIRTGNDPEAIPPTAEMVMQIIPLHHIGAAKVATDIATLIPSSATITANEDSNSLVVTDTQINVRHVVELVAALDLSVQSDSTMRIFTLKHADPIEMADLINNLYDTSSTSNNRGGNNNNAPNIPGMPPGAAAFMAARFGDSGRSRGSKKSSGSTESSASATPVSAVPDARTGSLIVTASKGAMDDIASIVHQLDESSAHKQKVFVYTLENASVQQVETILKNLFQSSNSRSTNTQSDALTNRANSNSQQTSGSFLGNSSSSGLR